MVENEIKLEYKMSEVFIQIGGKETSSVACPMCNVGVTIYYVA